ncbi:hypothetical protein QLH51_00600 [Sphingomonas sp. 2R-10]|uniref:hypothetical protein n=1 Tax=Sphingomonas sp. 2R-10 TaxID=3045148 RepID=UPI0019D28A45|nr:hypothetical protein [Sphingomonas sp. 2R-10]MDJ0275304.1 hypothetical protein [Sphingomonas sp. 2R-10]
MSPARGRPLRFLALVTVGWVGMRVTLLWPEGVPPEHRVRLALPEVAPVAAVAPVRLPAPAAWRPVSVAAMAGRRTVPTMPAAHRLSPDRVRPVEPARVQLALLALAGFGSAEPLHPILPPPIRLRPGGERRMTVSLWALARPGSATGGPVQLGGGQAGVRVRMPVDADGRAAVAARLATPLAGPGREAALGIEWRPVAASVAVVVERRVALDRGQGGTGLGLIAGVDRMLPGRLGVEAYGQAGAVARDGIEPYADGAARVLRPVATIGGSALKLGIGSWGGAQRGAMRVDIGPSLVAAIPVGRSAMRLSVDWRQRIAGNAAPGSGPALTLGSDF